MHKLLEFIFTLKHGRPLYFENGIKLDKLRSTSESTIELIKFGT